MLMQLFIRVEGKGSRSLLFRPGPRILIKSSESTRPSPVNSARQQETMGSESTTGIDWVDSTSRSLEIFSKEKIAKLLTRSSCWVVLFSFLMKYLIHCIEENFLITFVLKYNCGIVFRFRITYHLIHNSTCTVIHVKFSVNERRVSYQRCSSLLYFFFQHQSTHCTMQHAARWWWYIVFLVPGYPIS